MRELSDVDLSLSRHGQLIFSFLITAAITRLAASLLLQVGMTCISEKTDTRKINSLFKF